MRKDKNAAPRGNGDTLIKTGANTLFRRAAAGLASCAAASLFAACANLLEVKVDIVDQRTALENQVLGSYEDIGGDLLLMASVRSIDKDGRLVPAPSLSDSKKKALRAMQRSRFNHDDIERLKASGALGEANNGYLFFFKTDGMSADPKSEEFAKSLVNEENEDRKVIYGRIVEINESFKEDDLEKVEKIMAGLNRDSAKDGELVQLDSGEWTRKGQR